jgi:hypothetical protein
MAKEPRSGKTEPASPLTARQARVPTTTAEKPPRRAMTARSLAALLPGVTAPVFRRRSPAGARLLSGWRDIVGPGHAAQTTPQRLSAGTLTIACAGPVAMELQHHAALLIERINTWSGEKLVTRLRFVQDPTAGQPTRKTTPSRAPRQSVSLPTLPEGPLREALEALGASVRHERNDKKSQV